MSTPLFAFMWFKRNWSYFHAFQELAVRNAAIQMDSSLISFQESIEVTHVFSLKSSNIKNRR